MSEKTVSAVLCMMLLSAVCVAEPVELYVAPGCAEPYHATSKTVDYKCIFNHELLIICHKKDNIFLHTHRGAGYRGVQSKDKAGKNIR